MGKAGDNEKQFKEFFIDRYDKCWLKGKCVYKNNESGVSISVDNSIEFGNKKVLIEIDSGNMAKLLVGQYTLLNELCNEDKDILFMVIHYYEKYNSHRTIKNISFINKNIYHNDGIKIKAFNLEEFKRFCEKNSSIDKFIEELYK